MKIEKMIAQNDLDRVNLSISKGMLNKSERNGFKDEEKRLKEELKELKLVTNLAVVQAMTLMMTKLKIQKIQKKMGQPLLSRKQILLI